MVAERSRSLLHGTGGPRFESPRGEKKIFRPLAHSENGWMDARARVAKTQDWLSECDREKDRFFTLNDVYDVSIQNNCLGL